MILHVDMDAFYASVEEREDPSLQGKPLVVGGLAENRGVVSAANYAAREFGVYSAMPTATALQKCPNLKIISPRHDLYASISRQIREIFYRYTPVIEPLSLDEAFLDCSGSEKLHGDAATIGRKIKLAIRKELELVASVGVAPNKFLAKLASDHGKPDGFTVIEDDEVQEFLDPLPVDRIWGVGKVASTRLRLFGINTIADLRATTPAFLDQEFGQHGSGLWDLAHGRDSRAVTPDSEVKSVSQEVTFSEDISDFRVIESTAIQLVESVAFRLREAELKGKTVTLKIRYADFRTITRSHSMELSSNRTNTLWNVAKSLANETLSRQKFSIRLVGVGVSNFEGSNKSPPDPVQATIFGDTKTDAKVKEDSAVLDQLTDEIRKRFGKEGVKRGKSIRRP